MMEVFVIFTIVALAFLCVRLHIFCSNVENFLNLSIDEDESEEGEETDD